MGAELALRVAGALAGRVATSVAAAWLAAVAVTALVHAAPGDALSVLPDGEALRPALAARWHLDEPWPARVAHASGRLLHGDLGTSLVVRPGAPVTELIAAPALRTLQRTALAAVTLGALALALALRGSAAARARIGAASMLPVFVAAHLVVSGVNAVVWRGIGAGWWSRPAWFALPAEDTWHRETLAVLLLATASGILADLARELHGVVRALRDSDAAELIAARGESVRPFLLRHLVVPVTDRLAARAPALLSGAVILEHVLLLPGAGTLFWDAAELRDVEVAAALALVAGAAAVAARLAADVVRVLWDPREDLP